MSLVFKQFFSALQSILFWRKAGAKTCVAAFTWGVAPFLLAQPQSVLIEPDVQPQPVHEALIDTEDVEAGVYIGWLNIEDFETAMLKGINVTYHLSEAWAFDLDLAMADAGKSSFERLANVQLLSDDEREFLSYHLGVKYKLQGESYFSADTTFNHYFYVHAGAGNTDFGGDKNLSFSLGFGMTLLVSDEVSCTVGAKNIMFKSDMTGAEKNASNTALTLGVSMFF